MSSVVDDTPKIIQPHDGQEVCVAVEVGHAQDHCEDVEPRTWKPNDTNSEPCVGHTASVEGATVAASWWQDDSFFLRFHVAQAVVWLAAAVVVTYLLAASDDHTSRLFMFQVYAAVQCWGFFLGTSLCIINTWCRTPEVAALNLFFVYPLVVVVVNVSWLTFGAQHQMMLAHVLLGIVMAVINFPTFSRLAHDVRTYPSTSLSDCCALCISRTTCDLLLILLQVLVALTCVALGVWVSITLANGTRGPDQEDWGPFVVLLLFCFCVMIMSSVAAAFLVSHFRVTRAESAASGPLATEVNYQHLRELRGTTWRTSFASLFLCCFYGGIGPLLIATPLLPSALLGALVFTVTLYVPVIVRAHRVTVTCCRDALAYDDVLGSRDD